MGYLTLSTLSAWRCKRVMDMKLTKKQIDNAIQTLKEAGFFIPTMWHKDDVKAKALEMNVKLNKRELTKVCGMIEQNHDANIGVSWDFIESQIECM